MGSVRHPWICTVTNRVVNPLLPDENDIDIEDIATSLGNLCRFTGHCDFYSVAQHSVIVSYLVRPDYAREALLHDAAEAYLNDLNSPVKNIVKGDYARMEQQLEQTIAKKFGLTYPHPPCVKEADLLAFKLEVMRLYRSGTPLWKEYITDHKLYVDTQYKPIRLLGPVRSKQLFLARYMELFEAPALGDVANVINTEDEEE